MTRCLDCGQSTGRKHAKYCDRCRAPRRVKKTIWKPTPEIDEAIRSAWRSRAHGGRAYLVVQAKTKCGWPKWKISRRAIELGVARKYSKERAWSDEELCVLKQYAWMSPNGIQKKLAKETGGRRTLTAIVLKRKRLKLLGNRDFYSARHLGGLLGEDIHKVVRWIKAGWLKARPRGLEARTPQQGGDIYAIFPADVRRFLYRHPDEIDLAKVEKYWFLDLITAGKCQLVEQPPDRLDLPAERLAAIDAVFPPQGVAA